MARLIFMTDFSEAYARGLLLGVARYAREEGEAWSICRLPLSIRDKYGIQEVVDYALRTKADAVIGQFEEDDEILNIKGQNTEAGIMGAKYLMKKGFHNFAYYGLKDFVWSDERYAAFKDTILSVDPNYTFSELLVPQHVMWNYDYDRMAEWLISLPKPVAIMACDDNQA